MPKATKLTTTLEPIKIGRSKKLSMKQKLMQQSIHRWYTNEIKNIDEKLITNIPEHFRKPLMKVAYRLLSRDEATFEQLTPTEQKLWISFEKDQIYHFLTVEPDTALEFRFNWIIIPSATIKAMFTLFTTAAPSTTNPSSSPPMVTASTQHSSPMPSSSLGPRQQYLPIQELHKGPHQAQLPRAPHRAHHSLECATKTKSTISRVLRATKTVNYQ